eukprot:4370279-Pleurochrysis_carterae.AAC.2
MAMHDSSKNSAAPARPSGAAQLLGKSCIAARNATKGADLHMIAEKWRPKQTTWEGFGNLPKKRKQDVRT